MKKYKTKLSAHNAEEIALFIEHILTMSPHIDIGQSIAFAALEEVRVIISKKIVEHKREYSFSLTATQAIGLSYMYVAFIEGSSNQNQLANRMMQINNEILQLYAL